MSSGPQACRDDADEWFEIEKKLGISQYNWKVYSQEHVSVVLGNKDYGFTGEILAKFVKISKEFSDAKATFNNKLAQLIQINKI